MGPQPRPGRRGTVAVLLAVALLAAGCSGDSGDSDPQTSVNASAVYPSGAMVLRETVPTRFGDRRFAAANINGVEGSVSVVGAGGGLSSAKATKGATITLDGERFEVLDVVAGTDTSGAPGSSNGRIVLLPAD